MNNSAAYLADIELALIGSPVIAEYHILRSWANTDDGYIRVRATLTNSDFLEAAEYFVLDQDRIVTVDYRHQWMDCDRQLLRRRWDTTPDHPELENFPHHVHVGNEADVASSSPMSLVDLLRFLETEIA